MFSGPTMLVAGFVYPSFCLVSTGAFKAQTNVTLDPKYDP
jgi:hypothetical protein